MMDDGEIHEIVNCYYDFLERNAKLFKEAMWYHHISTHIRQNLIRHFNPWMIRLMLTIDS